MAKIDIMDIPKETLVDLLKMYSKNSMTIDGLWFINVEEKNGLDTALEIDKLVWDKYAVIEAKRIKNVLNITEKGIPAFVKAFNFQIWAPGMEYGFPEVTENKAIFHVTDCTIQKARIKDKRPEFRCKPIGLSLFTHFAEVIDPDIKISCLFCPPDKHPKNIWCSWEFRLEGSSEESIKRYGKINYSDLSKETLVELIRMYSRNILTIDELWFINVGEKFGLDAAVGISTTAWGRYGVTEARRIKRVLNINEEGIQAIAKAINFLVWVQEIDYKFPEVTEKDLVFNITNSTKRKERTRDKRGEFAYKSVVAMLENFTETIDPRLKINCLVCPPGGHTENVSYSWKFQLEKNI